MKVYHFGNFYMSSIQQGIQSAHAQSALYNKYVPNPSNDFKCPDSDKAAQLWEWSLNHVTMYCMNGGANAELLELKAFIEREDNTFPWSVFHEAPEAMGGMLTNIAVVLPERIYEMSNYYKRKLIEFFPTTGIETNVRVTDNANRLSKIDSQNLSDFILDSGVFNDFELELVERLSGYRFAI